MKKIFITFLFACMALVSFAQMPQMPNRPSIGQFRPNVDFGKYEVVDSLPIERIIVHFNKEIDDENLLSMGSGDYLAPVPHKDNMVIRTTADRTKAIVVHNSYTFGRHLEFDIQENERRLILYVKNDNLYCGYIYDKRFKVCKYFEDKKEFNRFMRRPIFNRFMPHQQ
jgi:hypothetical protein